jgi:hypothetical protein
MVKIEVKMEATGQEFNWLILIGKQPSPPVKLEKPKNNKSEEEEDMEDDKRAASGRNKNIYGDIITKWTSICQNPHMALVNYTTSHVQPC